MCLVLASMTAGGLVSGSAAGALWTVTAMDVIGVVSAGMGMMGARNTAIGQQQKATYDSQVAANNQIIANYQAEDAINRGDIEVKQHRLKVEQLKGRQRSVLATSGFDPNEDDSLDILADTAMMGEWEQQMIEANAQREAYQYRVAAQSSGAQSLLYQQQAANISPGFQAGAQAFSGLSDVSERWYRRNYS